jgi:TonB family protein
LIFNEIGFMKYVIILFTILSFSVSAQVDEETELEMSKEITIRVEHVDSTEVFKVVEQMPVYRGCLKEAEDKKMQCSSDAAIAHIVKNLVYPKSAIEKGIEGTVYVRYHVNKDAKVTNVEIVRGVEKELDLAALAVVKTLEYERSGVQNGKAVTVEMVVPIRFKL